MIQIDDSRHVDAIIPKILFVKKSIVYETIILYYKKISNEKPFWKCAYGIFGGSRYA